MITSETEEPSAVILFMEFDDNLLMFRDVRPGPNIPEGKLVQAFFDEGDEDTLASVNLVIFGFDRVTIPDGVIFFVEFEVIAAGDSDLIPLFAAENSATTPDSEMIEVTASDGAIDLSCVAVAMPLNVQATTNRSDAVLLSWAEVAGATEYRVFRGPITAQSPEAAAPLSGWFTGTQFLDTGAPAATMTGCAVEAVQVRYWVQAREREFCESDFGGPATGSRAPVAAKSAGGVSGAGGSLVMMALALGFLMRIGRSRRAFSA